MAVISYKSRIKQIVTVLQPLADQYDFEITMSDQKISTIRNTQSPLMFVGISKHRKLSYQAFTGDWNPEGGYFETTAIYSSLNTIFIDFYTFDYDFIDITQEAAILLNSTDFTEFNMTASFFEVITNLTDPNMLQGQLKQTAKVNNTFMMTDQITLPPVYKADKITINGTISGLNLNIEVNLDG